jgi:sarcosine oxidase
LEEQMRPTEFDADVAVVGLGAMGANALWRLTERGLRVIGIERFHPGHVLGSSHGKTRVFRVACLEHPNLVPLARRSRDLRAELQAASGAPVIRNTGAVMIGPESSEDIAGTLAAAAATICPSSASAGANFRRAFLNTKTSRPIT